MKFDRIAIVGAGDVGAYYGGRLAEAGHDVSFYTRSGAAALRAGGLHVQSHAGDFVLRTVQAFDNTNAIGPADLIIVSLKSTAIASYVDLVRPLVHDDSAIVCLQNGLGNEEVFAAPFGAARVLGAIAFTCINRTSPGHILHTAHGLLRIGEFESSKMDRAESIAAMFRAAKVPADAVTDLRHHRWEKLVWNIPFNGWGAALDLHTEAILASPAGETLTRETMAEVIRAARAVGIEIKPPLIDSEIRRTRLMGAYHSSMQLDRKNGQPLEIEAILARPLELAADVGETNLPLMTTLLMCLNALAVGNTRPAPLRSGCPAGAY
jgi:2-dehydropantoate 2-reductase